MADKSNDNSFEDSHERPESTDERDCRQFLEDEDSVDLLEFKAIEDDAAEILSRHKGGLYRNSLTNLSDTAVESLWRTEAALSVWSNKSIGFTRSHCLDGEIVEAKGSSLAR